MAMENLSCQAITYDVQESHLLSSTLKTIISSCRCI